MTQASDPVAAVLAHALNLHQAGQVQAAADWYRQVLARVQDHPDALHLLGVAEQQLGHLDEAERFIGRALERVPDWAEAWVNMGNVLAKRSDSMRAEAAFRRALLSRPDLPLAHFNLANTLMSGGREVEAVEHYRHALRLAPLVPELALNLGIALGRLGRTDEALACLSAARQRLPDHPEIAARLAALLREQGCIAEALAVLEDANRRQSGHPGLLHALGNVRLEQGRMEAAETSFRAALAADPGHAEIHFSLAETLRDLGREVEAKDHYALAVDLAPDNAAHRLGRAMASLPVVTGSAAEEAAAVEAFAADLAELESWAVGPERLMALGAVVGQTQPFLLAYREGDYTLLLNRYGDLVVRARQAWYARHFPVPAAPPSRVRRRLVVVSSHLRRHSVWDMLVHGVLAQLDRVCFEVIVYHTSAHQDAETERARALADRFEQGPRHERAWIESLLGDAPDVIWYPELGMDPVAVKLATLRLAPLQLASWGHPITTGLPTIDLFLSGEMLEPADGHAGAHYRERLVCLPGTGACPVPPEDEGGGLPPELPMTHGPRFLVGQQVIKLSASLDPLLVNIARRLGTCQFVVSRDRKYPWASDKMGGRLSQALTDAGLDPLRHLYFVDWLPRESFLGLMDVVDVYLDPPGFSGYTTAWLALRRGLPVVTLEGPYLRQRLAAGLLRRLGLDSGVAAGSNDYVDLAVNFGIDKNLRMTWSQLARAAVTQADADPKVARGYASIFEGGG